MRINRIERLIYLIIPNFILRIVLPYLPIFKLLRLFCTHLLEYCYLKSFICDFEGKVIVFDLADVCDANVAIFDGNDIDLHVE